MDTSSEPQVETPPCGGKYALKSGKKKQLETPPGGLPGFIFLRKGCSLPLGRTRGRLARCCLSESLWGLPCQEEIQEVKKEGNLEELFNSLDKIVEEAKDWEEPAW